MELRLCFLYTCVMLVYCCPCLLVSLFCQCPWQTSLGPHVPWSLVSVHNVLSPLCAGLPLTACAPRPGPGSLGRHWPGLCSHTRDSKGISELPLIQLTLPYKISCIRVSLEIPIISLGHTRDGTQTLHSANIASLAIYGGTMLIAASMANQELRGPGHNSLNDHHVIVIFPINVTLNHLHLTTQEEK